MSSKTKKKWHCTKIFTSNRRGSCGCGKPKLSDIIQPEPRSTITTNSSNSINDYDEDHTSTSFSPKSSNLSARMVSPCPKIIGSFAVVKNSNDPFQDFRQSMLQMILEKEINSEDDLNELLNCFLQLNDACHHDIIIQAFGEICNNMKIVVTNDHDDEK